MNAIALEESAGNTEFSVASQALIDHTPAMTVDFPARNRSASDELENALTHGFGLLLASIGAIHMVDRLGSISNGWLTLGCCTYLVCLLGVYSMSTASHGATSLPRKFFYRQLDQGFIYLLIVATYTPYSIAYLHGVAWNSLLCGMWAVAGIGFIKKVFLAHQVNRVSVLPPVLLGWVTIIAIPTLIRTAPEGAVNMILAGGACYTVGVIFLLNDERVKHFHAVWHLSVIAGSIFHFYGILNYVLAV